MKRRSLIDLTPMLDVILLLVFGFMFVLASTNSLLYKTEEDLDKALNENSSTIESLDQEILDLENENLILSEKIEYQDKNITKIKSGVQEYFKIDRLELEQALSQTNKENTASFIDRYSDEDDVAYSMVMYELLANEFYFVKVVLKGEDHRVFINDKSTPITLRFEDVINSEKRLNKISDIKDEISKIIDSRQGGSSMAFVTLSSDNDEVYHFAWDLTFDAIKSLEEKYGAKNYYSAEVFIKQED